MAKVTRMRRLIIQGSLFYVLKSYILKLFSSNVLRVGGKVMENKMKIISEIVMTAKKLGCSAEQLMEEADCLAEFGQFLHLEHFSFALFLKADGQVHAVVR